ncbi:hypothetical protein [Thiohalorhabdus methylotrophus]|uniref:Uncharacterized protein n=1 Tax=Thiohalorhabdus methylotrophus TaxID=3242694 RepID=A0ABV4TRG1_9GAMM
MAGERQANEQVVTGIYQGREVTLTDKTGEAPRQELQEILDSLIREDKFGIAGMSNSGSGTIQIGAPEGAHIQIGQGLYRLIVTGYEAYVDAF